MKELIEKMLLIDIATKMNESGVFDKVEEAEGNTEKLEVIALESEKVIFESVDNVFKSDEEINEIGGDEAEEGIKQKREIMKALIAHQYKFLEIPTPFENGITMDEVIKRNA